jgi:hypothetical protein
MRRARPPAPKRVRTPPAARRPSRSRPGREGGPRATTDAAMRSTVVRMLHGGDAHSTFENVIAAIPPSLRGVVPPGASHRAWQLLEHLRICQWDILEFSRDPSHVSPEFPEGLWPRDPAPPDDASWDRSVEAFRSDARAMQRLVSDAKRDVLARVDHPEARAKHTLVREALVLAAHNSYHLGQLVLLRRLLGDWEGR